MIRIPWRSASAVLLAISVAFLAIGAVSAAPSKKPKAKPKPKPRGIIYVESNVASGNTIRAFRYDAKGRLTFIAEYPTGGLGLHQLDDASTTPSTVLDADQQIVTNKAHTMLFAVNQGSDNISVFRIAKNGSLSEVAGSPFPSAGKSPVSLGLAASEHVLVVVNKNADPSQYQARKDASAFAPASLPSYTTFIITAGGALAQTTKVTTGPYNASPSQAAISTDGNLFFDAEFFTMRLRSYQIGPGGALTEAPGSPVQLDKSVLPQGVTLFQSVPIPLGLAVYPTRAQRLVYVDMPVVPGLAVFSYNQSGKLTFVRSAPHMGAPGTVVAACWLTMTPNRKTLYSANTGTNNITVFNISKPAQPRAIQLIKANGKSTLTEMGVDNTGTYLFVVGSRLKDDIPAGAGNILHVFRIAKNGTIKELASSPTPLGVPDDTSAQGLVAIRR